MDALIKINSSPYTTADHSVLPIVVEAEVCESSGLAKVKAAALVESGHFSPRRVLQFARYSFGRSRFEVVA